MAENTTSSSLDFQSSPYDPKWWLDPPSSQEDTCEFSPTSDSMAENQFSPCSNKTDLMYGPFPSPDFDNSFDEDDDYTTFNWYTTDLFHQLACLRKLPTQSVQSYLKEARSLLRVFESTGVPLSEIEFTDFLVEGLDDIFYITVHPYYQLMQPSFKDFSTFLFAHEKTLTSKQFESQDDPIQPQPTSPPSLPISSTPIRSTLLAPAGSLVHSLLYDSSSPHPAHIIPIFDDSFSQSGQSSSATMDFSDLFSAATNVVLPTSVTSASILPSISYHVHPPNVKALPRWLGNPNNSSVVTQYASKTHLLLASFQVFNEDVYGGLSQERQRSFSPHMFGRSLKFMFYFWLDVLIMHFATLYNLSWILFVFSIIRGVIISLALQSHGYFSTFKLQLRLPPFRLRGRIREIRYY